MFVSPEVGGIFNVRRRSNATVWLMAWCNGEVTWRNRKLAPVPSRSIGERRPILRREHANASQDCCLVGHGIWQFGSRFVSKQHRPISFKHWRTWICRPELDNIV